MGLASSRNVAAADGHQHSEVQEPERPHGPSCSAPATAHHLRSYKTLQGDLATSESASSIHYEDNFAKIHLSESLDKAIFSDKRSSCECGETCDCLGEDQTPLSCSSTDGPGSSSKVLTSQVPNALVSKTGTFAGELVQQNLASHSSTGSSSGTRRFYCSRQRMKQEDNSISGSSSRDRRGRPMPAEVAGEMALSSDALRNEMHLDACHRNGLHVERELRSRQRGIQEHLRRYVGLPSLLDVRETESRSISPAEAIRRRVRRSRMDSSLEMRCNFVQHRMSSLNDLRNAYGCSIESSLAPSASSFGRLHSQCRKVKIPSNQDFCGDASSVHNVSSRLIPFSGHSTGISQGEVLGREVRRTGGRRIWDSLTRVASHHKTGTRRNFNECERESRLPPHDTTALLNWRTSLSRVQATESAGPHVQSGRSLNLDERRRRFRSQHWALQRSSTTFEGLPGHARPCAPGGRHQRSQEVRGSEEPNTRASISRIIVLAEALFEVLDEIHQQSSSLSRSAGLSIGSVPAPDSVICSLPIRIHRKSEIPKNMKDDLKQCHICLVEYDDGDRVRVLPCHHEYHVGCVDKWLREVHRVCPLCRGDVCELSTMSDLRQCV